MPYGRPMKGKFRRVPATVHIPTGVLDIIDTHLEEINERDGTKITRSDFIVEAIEARIKELGLGDDGEGNNGVTPE